MRIARIRHGIGAAIVAGLAAAAVPGMAEVPPPPAGDAVRLATYNVELHRRGPGLLLRDIADGEDDVMAAAGVIAAARPDVLVLQGIDWDHGAAALAALAERVAEAGHPMPHRFAHRPNTGIPAGLDVDGDGRSGGPRDTQGYGQFPGQGGMAVLSRHPIAAEAARDLSDVAWADLPDSLIAPDDPLGPEQRLSSVAHWAVPVDAPGGRLTLLAWHATPPVFDGPEDRNGRRNHDEAALWLAYLGGALGPPPDGPVVVIGDTNLDPVDGEGRREALTALLDHPRLADLRPRSQGGAAAGADDPDHRGDPAFDTVDWPDGAPGNLRVSYVLPDRRLRVAGAGVLWPADGPLAETVETASRHRLVWVDVRIPGGAASVPAD